MALALFLTLLLPVAQDDPQVTYREGLFEEVDQGNLEKASELYQKVLKSNAPDALKAKALLRTGFCLEKKGKKKEAEQAWRDVIERFPGAGETVKLARERLSLVEGAPSAPSQDQQIRNLILELGSLESRNQAEARRTLLLLGDATVADLKKALKHADRTLSNNAAQVLMDMGLFDGVYDSIRRFWGPKGRVSLVDLAILPILLKDDGTRNRFKKDLEPFKNSNTIDNLAGLLVSLAEPEFSQVVEDWIVQSNTDVSRTLQTWAANRSTADYLRLMKRLGERTPHRLASIFQIFYIHANSEKTPDKFLVQEAIAALEREPDPSSYFHHLQRLAPYVGITPLVRGPLAKWFEERDEAQRTALLMRISELRHDDNAKALAAECRKFLFERMESPKVALAEKELIVSSGFTPDSSEEKKKYLEFCLQYWKENRETPSAWKGRKTWTEGEKKKYSTMVGVMHTLVTQLPSDSKELPEILDALFDVNYSVSEPKGELAPAVVSAALRSLVRNEDSRVRVLKQIQAIATPQELLQLGPILSKLGNGESAVQAAGLYAKSFKSMDRVTEAHWKQLREVYDASVSNVQETIVQALQGHPSSHADTLMDAAARSDNPDVRYFALGHWAHKKMPDGNNRLLAALKDPSTGIQVMAIHRLAESPSLEVVPHMIEMLNSPSSEVRETVSMALDKIKKHFEAQAEWKRWYDETKKALEK